jgi:hypothetical protein
MPVTANFLEDLRHHFLEKLRELGASALPKGRDDTTGACIGYFNVLWKLISRRPREIYVAPELNGTLDCPRRSVLDSARSSRHARQEKTSRQDSAGRHSSPSITTGFSTTGGSTTSTSVHRGLHMAKTFSSPWCGKTRCISSLGALIISTLSPEQIEGYGQEFDALQVAAVSGPIVVDRDPHRVVLIAVTDLIPLQGAAIVFESIFTDAV